MIKLDAPPASGGAEPGTLNPRRKPKKDSFNSLPVVASASVGVCLRLTSSAFVVRSNWLSGGGTEP